MSPAPENPSELIGPLMIDLQGTAATAQERAWLQDRRVGGLILFSRNFDSAAQIQTLVADVRAASDSPLLIAVDHEGGRVQRFRDGFTAIPPMRALGALPDTDTADHAATVLGGVIGAELAQLDIDLCFAPVLDVDWGNSSVIGDRAFHHSPQRVAELGAALMRGLHGVGMAAVGKHFPGHGYVAADSHLALPIDSRDLDTLRANDVLPFAQLAAAGLDGVMPAHVVYEQIDALPAGFSPFWIQQVLREDIGFRGAVFSDDLSMVGAASVGSIHERAQRALSSGCDMVLVCNTPDAVGDLLSRDDYAPDAHRSQRLSRLCRRDDAETRAYVEQVFAERDAVLTLLA